MNDRFWKFFAIALLAILAVREFASPRPGFAQSRRNLYIEPGTVDIPLDRGGNRPGKVVIDLETGDTYGYPVFGPDRPYPGKQLSEDAPLVSRPQHLGKFNLDELTPGAGSRRRY